MISILTLRSHLLSVNVFPLRFMLVTCDIFNNVSTLTSLIKLNDKSQYTKLCNKEVYMLKLIEN